MTFVGTCIKLVILLGGCRFLYRQIDKSIAAFMVHTFTLLQAVAYKSTSITQHSAFAITNTARHNALTYQSIELEKYVYNQSPINDEQQDVSLSHLASTKSAAAKNKYGVTSLHVIPFRQLNQPDSTYRDVETNAIFLVFVGTKYGELVTLPFEVRNSTWLVSRVIPVELLSTATGKPPFPNFCIVSVPRKTDTILLVGSADRYVHIWQKNHETNWIDTDRRWNNTQQLGPHTGWVKSLAALPSIAQSIKNHSNGSVNPVESDSIQYRLISIGCNRIEYWKCNCTYHNSKADNTWAHISTTSITSSPDVFVDSTTKSRPSSGVVCTLSSDLLCLEVCNIVTTSNQTNTVIAVGGVDGRIHFYIDRRNKIAGLEHLTSVTAHRGRVNVLSYDTTRQRLISGSHDGTIHCWSFHLNDIGCHNVSLTIDQIASHQVHDGERRVTALLCFTPQTSNSSFMNIIVGTHIGSIHVLKMIDIMELGKCEIIQSSDIHIDTDNNSETASGYGPIINALCRLCLVTPKSCIPPHTFVVVGHSHGMGIVQIYDEAEDHT